MFPSMPVAGAGHVRGFHPFHLLRVLVSQFGVITSPPFHASPILLFIDGEMTDVGNNDVNDVIHDDNDDEDDCDVLIDILVGYS